MPRSVASGMIQARNRELVDARALGKYVGFSPQYFNKMANEGKIPWHGIRNGVRVYKRFSVSEVLAALSHGIEEPVAPTAPASAAQRRKTTKARKIA